MRKFFVCASESHGSGHPFRVEATASMIVGDWLDPHCSSPRTHRSWRAKAGCRRGCRCRLVILWPAEPYWEEQRRQYEHGY